jgi:uncharacterized RDD family membrane protein YckC
VVDHYGGFWRRMMAFLIDKMILFGISIFLFFIGLLALSLGFLSHYHEFMPARFAEVTITFVFLFYCVTVFISMFYFTYFHGTTGQTFGKVLFGLKVVQATGEKMTLGIGFLRWVGYVISAAVIYLGFIWIAIDGRKQGWHDKIAGTVVIRVKNIVNGLAYSPGEDSTNLQKQDVISKERSD